MNTNALARMYDGLTPWERVPLMHAAQTRGDEVELARLRDSTPRVVFGIPDSHPLLEALDRLRCHHLLTQLDTAVLYGQVLGAFGQDTEPAGVESEKTRAREEQLLRTLKTFAYLLTTHAEAWRQLCTELKLDADALLRRLPGYETVRQTEELARGIAFTEEEATAYLCEGRGEGAEAVTVESVVNRLRACLQWDVGRWE
jgi:hypothetical protein